MDIRRIQETVPQYRKRCGGRPLGMIMKMSEGDDKVELIKLYNKAMKMIAMAHS